MKTTITLSKTELVEAVKEHFSDELGSNIEDVEFEICEVSTGPMSGGHDDIVGVRLHLEEIK